MTDPLPIMHPQSPKVERAISLIIDKKITGKLYLISRDGTLNLRGVLYFLKGNLVDAKSQSDSGADVIFNLFRYRIVSAKFVPGDGTNYRVDLEMPNIRTIVGSQRPVQDDPVFLSSLDGKIIVEAATDILRETYGGDADELVRSTVELYPLEEGKGEFVAECKKLATQIVGDESANELIKPL